MTLKGLLPADLYYDHKLETPKREAKTVPDSIERHVFAETRTTAYRLMISDNHSYRSATIRITGCG